VPQFYPGYIRSLAAFKERRQRSDRVFFAGDYLVCPYTEAALTSGLRAADDVRARFDPAGPAIARIEQFEEESAP
jgi:hypothetical protein